MTNVNSIEEINAEIEALAEKKRNLVEASAKNTKEEKEAKEKAERLSRAQAKLSTRTSYFNQIADLIKEAQPTWTVDVKGHIDTRIFGLEVYHSFLINGHDTWLNFSERHSGTWSSQKTIGIDIKLDGKRWQNREGKGYDFAAIAASLIEVEHGIILKKKWEAAKETNKANVEKVVEAIEPDERKRILLDYKFKSSSTVELPIFAEIKISRAMTEEQAIRLGKFLRAEGLL